MPICIVNCDKLSSGILARSVAWISYLDQSIDAAELGHHVHFQKELICSCTQVKGDSPTAGILAHPVAPISYLDQSIDAAELGHHAHFQKELICSRACCL